MAEAWDVIVVGAGPAGCATAFHAARAGYRVALLDRAEFPRAKTCGDGLTPRALHHVDAMGVRLGAAWPRIGSIVHVDLAQGRSRTTALPSSAHGTEGRVVTREVLDDALRAAAVDAGAEFRGGCEVRELCWGGNRIAGVAAANRHGPVSLDARIVVVGEGAAGRLGRRVVAPSRDRPSGVAVRQYVRLAHPVARSFHVYAPLCLEGEAIFGYGWVFPVSAEVANVGVGWFLPPANPERARLVGLHAAFLGRLAETDPAFAPVAPCGPLEGGLVPSGFALHRGMAAGALVVGDAARAANPFTGEGIAQALDSGEAAAGAIDAHLMRGRPLDVEFVDRLQARFPDTVAWDDVLPWIAERGRVRAGEFAELMADPRGLLGRATRSAVLEEEATSAGLTWERAHGVLAERHPILAELVAAVRRDREVDVHGLLDAFRRANRDAGEDTAVAAALVMVLVLLASDVSDDDTTDDAIPWARSALALGAVDLLVAEVFALLATLPADAALAFSGSVERLVMGLASGDGGVAEAEVALAAWAREYPRDPDDAVGAATPPATPGAPPPPR